MKVLPLLLASIICECVTGLRHKRDISEDLTTATEEPITREIASMVWMLACGRYSLANDTEKERLQIQYGVFIEKVKLFNEFEEEYYAVTRQHCEAVNEIVASNTIPSPYGGQVQASAAPTCNGKAGEFLAERAARMFDRFDEQKKNIIRTAHPALIEKMEQYNSKNADGVNYTFDNYQNVHGILDEPSNLQGAPDPEIEARLTNFTNQAETNEIVQLNVDN